MSNAKTMLDLADLIEADPEWFATEFDDQVLIDSLRFHAQAANAQEPVAFVPVHPRQGPLWSDTVPAGSEVHRSTSYPRMSLYATTQPATAQGAVRPSSAGTVNDALVIEPVESVGMKGAVREAVKNHASMFPTEPQTPWQPIETAPKDGSKIDLWHPTKGRFADSFWCKQTYALYEPWGWSNQSLGRIVGVTHWTLVTPPLSRPHGDTP